MKPIDAMTDFSEVTLPDLEGELSRRYLKIFTRWIPVGLSYFNEWPGRPNCGHFFGGVLWYGQETAMVISSLALAASSPEFDEELAGISAPELRQVALKGLRYLCFTHDIGPEDCIRPEESWGRTEPAGTKWGERGRGFFPESQCGRTISNLLLTAALMPDLIGAEERELLANIAADYLDRFGDMAPKAGVYNNTQTEENAWTAEGLVSSLLLLPNHERASAYWENTKRWMFRTSTMPRDAYDHAVFADGKTVAELCGRIYTTLPDGTAENHGFVHPSYMGSAISLSGLAINLLHLFGREAPPHMFWHRQETYDLLKSWCDNTGVPHCVQGMDWPYLAYPVECFLHSIANVFMQDPDAALLERRALEIVERSSLAHGGRMVTKDTIDHCHGQQDPSLMRERMSSMFAQAYFTHRLAGEGQTPSEASDCERRLQGVHVYPHGGALVHRHEHGLTSLSWRNRTMVLPAPPEGLRLIGPAGDSMLAQLQVRDKARSTKPVALKIREGKDRVAVLLEQVLAEASVRRQVFFASLPGGKALIAERLLAQEDLTVESVVQGRLNVINDGWFGDHEDLRGRRTIHWDGGEREFVGYPTGSAEDDVTVELGKTGWVNIDDRAGLVFQGTGAASYCNRRHFQVWHAVEDELTLSDQQEPREYGVGEEIASLISLWCPEQAHEGTAAQEMTIHETPEGVVAVQIDGFLCACNFGDEAAELAAVELSPEGAGLPVSWGVRAEVVGTTGVRISILPQEPGIVELGGGT